MINHKELLRRFSYDPNTGDFTRRVRCGRFGAGTKAGRLCKDGYVTLHIDHVFYRAHRLAWLYVYGKWPADQIDHRNLDRGDNRIANLREATNAQNHANLRKPRTNTSGYKGVRLDRRRGKWRSEIKVDGKIIWLGYHDTAEGAAAAYAKAANERFLAYARIE